MPFRVGLSGRSPPAFKINEVNVSYTELCKRIRDHLDSNGYVDIEPPIRDLLPDNDLVNRIRELQCSPQIVPPSDMLVTPQITNVVQRTMVMLPHSIKVWHGSSNIEFRAEMMIDHQTRSTNDPYVKITRVWFPWTRVPEEHRVVHMSLYGQRVSSFRMRDEPVALNMHMIPADAPITFVVDSAQPQELCMEFIYEMKDPPMRPGRNKTAFIRHRYSPEGGVLELAGEQLVAVRVHVGDRPPENLRLTVDEDEAPLYRAGDDLEYCASIVRDSGAINDGPSCSNVQLSHPIPFSVSTKAILDITSQKSCNVERQDILNSI